MILMSFGRWANGSQNWYQNILFPDKLWTSECLFRCSDAQQMKDVNMYNKELYSSSILM